MKWTVLTSVGIWVACSSGVFAQTAVWNTAANGNWTNTANWLNGNLPGDGTNVSINYNGTYTNTVSTTNYAGDIVVGATASSGTQTLSLADGTTLFFSNLTIGARGVATHGHNTYLNGTGVVTVANGGILIRRTSASTVGYGSHEITIQSGGRYHMGDKTFSIYNNPIREMAFTIDGSVDGDTGSGFSANNSGTTTRMWITGSGIVNVPFSLDTYNGNVYLGGSLTLNAVISHSNAVVNKASTTLSNNASITLNGPYMHSGNGSVLLVWTNTASAVVTGTNLISVSHNAGGDMTFSGAKVGSAGGTLTLAGTGSLEVYQGGTGLINLSANVLNLQRNSRFWGTNSAGAIRPTGAIALNVSGAGKTMMLYTNIVMDFWNSNTVFNISGGATLDMRGAILEGGSKGAVLATNVLVGVDSVATLLLKANATNLFRRAADTTYALSVLIGPNATVSAEAGTVLQLSVCNVAVGTTNAAFWPWKTSGTIECLTNATFEAMSTDQGANVLFSADPFGVKSMNISCANNTTLTLFNGGAGDNDLDMATDAALYVETLNLTGMGAGTTLGLNGSGIAAPRLYYVTLVNPAGVTLDAKIRPLTAQQGSVSCTITNSPIPSGAQWKLTTGPDTSWKNSGDFLSVEFGTYTQSFKAVGGYLTPADLPVGVLSGQSTNTQVLYQPDVVVGAVQVTLAPAQAVSGGAQWRLTTGYETNWQASGAILDGLAAGPYTVTYKTGVPHWYGPGDALVTVSASETNQMAGTYSAMPVYSLSIESLMGVAIPPVGATNIEEGSVVSSGVGNSPITAGTTQFVCTGWSRTGSSAGSGATTNSTFTITEATTHTWMWKTNYFLQTAAGFGGTADQNGTWWRSTSNATVTATLDDGYALATWSGDVPEGSQNDNPLVLPMDRPRSVTATFAPVAGLTAVWTNKAGGVWTTAVNWLNGVLPGPATNVDINADGTYMSTNSGANSAKNIAVGTTSPSGFQTLYLPDSSPLTFSNLTIGAHGILSQGHNSGLNGTAGTVTVASGGLLLRRAYAIDQGYGEHDMTIAAGGKWTLQSNSVLTVGTPSRPLSYTIDGTVDGGGLLHLNNNGTRTWFTGTGTLGVANVTLNDNNGNLCLGGSLTVNSTINQSNAVICSVVLSNNADITLNGPYYMQKGGKALLVVTNTASARVTGTNLVSICHDINTLVAVLTGARDGAAGGTLTLTGSGDLEVNQACTNRVELQAAVFNLQRNSRFWGITNAGAIRPTGALALNFSGNGKTLTLDTNSVVSFWNSNTVLNVSGTSSLALRNGIVEGGSKSPGSYTNVIVGQESLATLALRENSTNVFRRAPDVTNELCVLLGSNATVSPEAGSVLKLEDCRFGVGVQNAAAWGWRTTGVMAIGTGVVFEAMNSDLGMNFPQGAADRSVKELRLEAPGNVTLALFNNGSTDNDGDLIVDSVIYVDTLDLSGMAAGTTVTVAAATGSGIATPRLYFRWWRNPNNVAVTGGLLCTTPPGTVYLIR